MGRTQYFLPLTAALVENTVDDEDDTVDEVLVKCMSNDSYSLLQFAD
jgi:hypothetical protein